MYSILHISDLHRSHEDPITNAELLSSLRADMHRYLCEQPPIRKPDAIVVTGDIVQGVPMNVADHEALLASQYEVAEDFLSKLCDEILDGDRSRLVLVPGNHDVNWSAARNSMIQISSQDEPKYWKALQEESEFRWDWKTKSFYRIHDEPLYARRLDAYWDFAERFYASSTVAISFSRESAFNIFTLHEGRIGVAAFNSCHGNDCFAFHGAIERAAISASHLELSSREFELWVAVWHHNVEGPPYRTDYMNIDSIYNMIDRGFRLGLHGHQHRNQAEAKRIFLPESERMVVVSAGSLCAGRKELPKGLYRQYNVVELSDDLQSARIHVRHMAIAERFSPAHLDALGGRSYIDLDWEQPREIRAKKMAGPQVRHAALVRKAEQLFGSGKATEAANLLIPIIADLQGFGRAVFYEAAAKAQTWDLIVQHAMQPTSLKELLACFNACERLGKTELARTLLKQYGPSFGLGGTLQNELETRLSIREMQGQ